jgi:L-asparaginase II
VIVKHECFTKHDARQDHSYKVILAENHSPKCKCREPQNMFITCKHVLAVCAAQNYNPNNYTHQFHSIQALVTTAKKKPSRMFWQCVPHITIISTIKHISSIVYKHLSLS